MQIRYLIFDIRLSKIRFNVKCEVEREGEFIISAVFFFVFQTLHLVESLTLLTLRALNSWRRLLFRQR